MNDLRETFHRWVRTLAFPVRNGALGEPLPHVPASKQRTNISETTAADRTAAAEALEDIGPDLQGWLRQYRNGLSERLRGELEVDGADARSREDERYRQRQGEVSQLIERSTVDRLNREVQQLDVERRQGRLFGQAPPTALRGHSAHETRTPRAHGERESPCGLERRKQNPYCTSVYRQSDNTVRHIRATRAFSACFQGIWTRYHEGSIEADHGIQSGWSPIPMTVHQCPDDNQVPRKPWETTPSGHSTASILVVG